MSWKQRWPEDRAARAVELRLQGHTYDRIAAEIGVTKSMASSFLDRHAKRLREARAAG
jgi:transposase-like protein